MLLFVRFPFFVMFNTAVLDVTRLISDAFGLFFLVQFFLLRCETPVVLFPLPVRKPGADEFTLYSCHVNTSSNCYSKSILNVTFLSPEVAG